MEVKLNLSNSEHKDLVSYCNLNDLLVSQVVKDSFLKGFNIQKYGLLNSEAQVIEKEVIREVEKIVEVPVIKEKIVEKIVEIPVERIVYQEKIIHNDEKLEEIEKEKIELLKKIEELRGQPPKVVEVIKEVQDNTKNQLLQETLQKLRSENLEKDKKIKELEKQIDGIRQEQIQKGAVYLRGSNLNDTLFK